MPLDDQPGHLDAVGLESQEGPDFGVRRLEDRQHGRVDHVGARPGLVDAVDLPDSVLLPDQVKLLRHLDPLPIHPGTYPYRAPGLAAATACEMVR